MRVTILRTFLDLEMHIVYIHTYILTSLTSSHCMYRRENRMFRKKHTGKQKLLTVEHDTLTHPLVALNTTVLMSNARDRAVV